jgi:hypothetical protein
LARGGLLSCLPAAGCEFDAEIGEALLVDVGGGRGHDAATFAELYGNLPGKVVLHDRESVVASIMECAEGRVFEVQAYDIFTTLPVKGARAYFFIPFCMIGVMKKNLLAALVRGYSRVLFDEIVISEEKPMLAATSRDMMMLAHFSAREDGG